MKQNFLDPEVTIISLSLFLYRISFMLAQNTHNSSLEQFAITATICLATNIQIVNSVLAGGDGRQEQVPDQWHQCAEQAR